MIRCAVLLVLLAISGILQAANQPLLGFYIVSQEAGPGLHFVDSLLFPKLGYIAEKPDITISHLEAVWLDTCHDRSRYYHKGGSVEQTNEDRPALDIRLSAADAKALEALTSAHLGSRILLMAGSDPLFAPVIRSPVGTQELQFALPIGADAEKLKARLQTLVSKPQ